MCVDDDERKCNLKTSLINCTGHPIMHRTPNTNQGLRSRTSNATATTDFQLVFKFEQMRKVTTFGDHGIMALSKIQPVGQKYRE